MWCDVMWRDVTWRDVMWCDVMWCDVMWCDVTIILAEPTYSKILWGYFQPQDKNCIVLSACQGCPFTLESDIHVTCILPHVQHKEKLLSVVRLTIASIDLLYTETFPWGTHSCYCLTLTNAPICRWWDVSTVCCQPYFGEASYAYLVFSQIRQFNHLQVLTPCQITGCRIWIT
jgi:hypothetical protein